MAIECPPSTVRDQSLQIRFPGGAAIVAQWPAASGPPPLSLAKQLMAQSSAGSPEAAVRCDRRSDRGEEVR